MRRSTQLALATYYYGSLPFRWRAAVRRASQGNAPVMVVFYHRIADDHPNSWTLSTRQFQRQIEWLQRRYDLVTLEEAQARIQSGCNRRPAVSITFDDGYADNESFALPLLIRCRVPCTYFVSVHNIVTGEPFPHDVAAGRPLRPNTVDALRGLAEKGIEIGLHTRAHADLGRVTQPNQLFDEVVDAGTDLANLLDRPVRYFAFPYGLHANLNVHAFRMARQAGYLGVCSAYGGYNFPGEDPFHLQRIHADSQWIRWKNWLTVDPRKVRVVERFQWKPEAWEEEKGLTEDERECHAELNVR